ncbi:hypothetical protein PI125_g12738 [Phytophthora idaei]|nr:hypothetical protein PI125_g12738 [Phytophthora idaei]
MISRVKHVFKRYGRTAFIFHSTIFVTTLAGSYAAIQRGVDLQALAKRVPILDLSKLDPDAGTLALAYVSTVELDAFSQSLPRPLLLVRGRHHTNTNKMTLTRRRFPKQ